jgi:predicted DsbA family dithiol-disulfide isomerase
MLFTQASARPGHAARIGRYLVFSVWIILALQGAHAAAATPDVDSQISPATVIATVGHQTITEADVLAQDQAAFDKIKSDYELKLHVLKLHEEQDRYALVQKQANRMLDSQAVELEAKSRGLTTEAVLKEIAVPAVTEAEARAYYEANKSRTHDSFEQLQPEITQYLANQHNTDASRKFYDSLRAKHNIALTIPPYRMMAAAVGPARGNERARVTIVEFGDFQCPYCRQAEATVRGIIAKYPNDVRLVFRELPLASIHPNAYAAARAAVCADRQGKFWPMHDALYADQSALSDAGLLDTAKRLGLDATTFSSCLPQDATNDAIVTDINAADELAITGTPFFLVNGRPINGVVPMEQFEAVVTDELKKTAGTRG